MAVSPGWAVAVLSVSLAAQDALLGAQSTELPSTSTQTVVGDVNGDAVPDLVDKLNGGGLVLRIGRGDGEFESPAAINDSLSTDAVFAMGELTGDGYDDLAIIRATPEVVILSGNALGEFAPFATIPLPTAGRAINIADVTNDGVTDLVVALRLVNQAQIIVRVYVGLGSGGFAIGPSSGVISSGLSFPKLHLGDINGDGFVDVVHESLTAGFTILTGLGAGNLAEPLTIGNESHDDLLVADINGDTLDDVVLSTYDQPLFSNRRLMLYPGTLGGLFGPAEVLVSDPGPGLIAGDLNGDGRIDLISGRSAGELDIRLQSLDGTLGDPRPTPTPHVSAGTLILADIDHDGHLDLLNQAPHALSATDLTRSFGDGEGGFGPTYTGLDGDHPESIASFRRTHLADFDGDGQLDLLTVMDNSSWFSLRAGRAGRDFAPETLVDVGTSSLAMEVALGEVTGDGLIDLILAIRVSGGPDRIEVHAGLGDFTFASPVLTVVDDADTLDVIDLTGDGLDDLVARQDPFVATVFVAQGDGTFVAAPSAAILAAQVNDWDVASMDGDAFPDLVVTTGFPAELQVYSGAAGPTFVSPAISTRALPAIFNELSLGRVNDDAHLDAVVLIKGSGDEHVLQTWLGDGAGGWSSCIESARLSFEGGLDGLDVADVNRDGWLDVVVSGEDPAVAATNESEGIVMVLTGDGTGHFTEQSPVIVAERATHPTTGDIDGDGAPDVVVTIRQRNQSTVLFSTHGPWDDLMGGLQGEQGLPSLTGQGTLLGGDDVTIALANARALAPASLVVGLSTINVPFAGGIWVPDLTLLIAGLPIDGDGQLSVGGVWPAGVPAGVDVFFQYWIPDAAALAGFAGSNAMRATTPITSP